MGKLRRRQDAQAGGQAENPRSGLRLRFVSHRRVSIPARLASGILHWPTTRTNGPKAASPRSCRPASGWKLTIAERKRILLDNIYGVDIDTQAVEVTKLSLLLKVLEGETGADAPDRSSDCFRNARCPTWATTSNAATRSSARIFTSSSNCPCSTKKNATASTSSTGTRNFRRSSSRDYPAASCMIRRAPPLDYTGPACRCTAVSATKKERKRPRRRPRRLNPNGKAALTR